MQTNKVSIYPSLTYPILLQVILDLQNLLQSIGILLEHQEDANF